MRVPGLAQWCEGVLVPAALLVSALASAQPLGPAGAAARTGPPPTSASSELPTTLAQGPYPSIAALCRALASEQPPRRCARRPNAVDSGAPLPGRAGLLAARALLVERSVAAHDTEHCHLALLTPRGWYLSANQWACGGAGVAGGELRPKLSALRWADEMRLGVAELAIANDDTVVTAFRRWWGEQSVETSRASGTTLWCSAGAEGVPACAGPYTTACEHSQTYDAVRVADGQLLVGPAAASYEACGGPTLRPGRYALGRLGAGTAPGLPTPAPGDGDEALVPGKPLALQRLYGPFSSIASYCAAVPSYGSTSSFDTSDSPAQPDRCSRRRGGWAARGVSGQGAIGAVRFLEIETDLAGATQRHCRIAMRIHGGWFVSHDTGVCGGVAGPGVSARRTARAARWLGPGPGSLLYVEYEQDLGDRTLNARVCGLGPNDTPGCSAPFPLSCMDAEGRMARASVHHEGATVAVGPPYRADVDSFSGPPCSELQGRYPIVWASGS